MESYITCHHVVVMLVGILVNGLHLVLNVAVMQCSEHVHCAMESVKSSGKEM